MTIRSALRTCGSAVLLVAAALLVARLFLPPGESASPRARIAELEPEAKSESAPLVAAPALEVQRAPEGGEPHPVEHEPSLEPEPVKLSALQARFAGRALALEHPEFGSPVPDPVETGSCAFLLRLVDAASGAPCASSVQLWRLDAPESETMTRGDQYVRALDVPIEGARVDGLAAGRYRLVAVESGASSDDPAAFVIEEAQSELVVPIARPQSIALELALFDLQGNRLREARAGAQLHYHMRRVTPGPRWELARRLPRWPFEDDVARIGSGGGWSTSARSSPRRMQANALGWFELGSLREGTREWQTPARIEASAGDAQGPKGFVLELHPARPRWVSVVCPKALVLASLRCRDGSDPIALASYLHLSVEALPVALGEETVRWAEVPVIASLRRPELPPLEFRFTARDLPLPIRWLD